MVLYHMSYLCAENRDVKRTSNGHERSGIALNIYESIRFEPHFLIDALTFVKPFNMNKLISKSRHGFEGNSLQNPPNGPSALNVKYAFSLLFDRGPFQNSNELVILSIFAF
jgi:hypothetical protein